MGEDMANAMERVVQKIPKYIEQLVLSLLV
jgi:hypothetical protein